MRRAYTERLRSEQEELSRGDETERRKLAYASLLVTEIQEVLSGDPSEDVRCVLAANRSLVPSVQMRLARDASDYVRADLAQNPSLVTTLQKSLSHDKSPMVVENLVENPSLNVSPAFSARFLWLLCPDAYYELTGRADREILKGLVANWEGSLDSLIQASRLVAR